jgi:hypothetical protein
MFVRTLVIAGVFVISATAWSAESTESGETVRLVLTPAVEPVPALRYQLLPSFVAQRSGNAAVRYLRVATHYRPKDEVNETVSQALAKPLAEFAATTDDADLQSVLKNDVFAELQRAARLDRCEWELPLREQMAFAVLLPELQEMRRLARYIALRARRDVVDGNFDAAVERLQIGYAMARHTSAGPTLIHGLVGVAMAQTMNLVLLDLSQSPGAPSLYWAVSAQPRPFIDPRPGLVGEMSAVELSFPTLFRRTEAEPRTTEEWTTDAQRFLRELSSLVGQFESTSGSEPSLVAVLTFVGVMAKIALRRDELRAELVDYGLPKGTVEKMSDPQLCLELCGRQYTQLRDDQFRWMMLPYHEGRAGLEAAEKRLLDTRERGRELIPLASVILPAVGQVRHSHARSERRIDALRIIEALRLHAAKHDGRLPASLADVDVVPIPPLDVVTGQPFRYSLNNGTARLELPEESRRQGTPLVYEITIAAGK